MNNGFYISLDFELFWGIRDKKKVLSSKIPFKNTREIVIPEIIRLSQKYKVNITWATVGMLFAENMEEAISYFPDLKPNYDNKSFNPYLDKVVTEKISEDYLFTPELIKQIHDSDYQELATHTFSHYYCLATPISAKAFEADILAAKKIAKDKYDADLKSIVLPRNHLIDEFLKILEQNGIICYRGNMGFLYSPVQNEQLRYITKGGRFIERYMNLGTVKDFDLTKLNTDTNIINNPASRFFHSLNSKQKKRNKLFVRNVKKEMTKAAANKNSYHLWWHPHNFEAEPNLHLDTMEELFSYFGELNKKFDFQSYKMENSLP